MSRRTEHVGSDGRINVTWREHVGSDAVAVRRVDRRGIEHPAGRRTGFVHALLNASADQREEVGDGLQKLVDLRTHRAEEVTEAAHHLAGHGADLRELFAQRIERRKECLEAVRRVVDGRSDGREDRTDVLIKHVAISGEPFVRCLRHAVDGVDERNRERIRTASDVCGQKVPLRDELGAGRRHLVGVLARVGVLGGEPLHLLPTVAHQDELFGREPQHRRGLRGALRIKPGEFVRKGVHRLNFGSRAGDGVDVDAEFRELSERANFAEAVEGGACEREALQALRHRPCGRAERLPGLFEAVEFVLRRSDELPHRGDRVVLLGEVEGERLEGEGRCERRAELQDLALEAVERTRGRLHALLEARRIQAEADGECGKLHGSVSVFGCVGLLDHVGHRLVKAFNVRERVGAVGQFRPSAERPDAQPRDSDAGHHEVPVHAAMVCV